MGPENFWESGMWIFPVIMIVIMLLVAFGFVRRRGFRPPWSHHHDRHHNQNHGAETPLDILKKRYAKGEITKEEFENMKKDI